MSASPIPSRGATIAPPRPRPLAAIFWGGLLAGIFDITQAFVGFGLLGAKPFRILQHIAGGVFGARSMQMGWTSAWLGLGFHFTIAFTAAAVYYLASRVLLVMIEHAVVCGLLYGELVFTVHVFCRAAALGAGARPIQSRNLHHRADRPHGFGGAADRALDSAFRKVNDSGDRSVARKTKKREKCQDEA